MTYCVVYFEADNINTAYFDCLVDLVAFLGHLRDDGVKYKVINLFWKENENDL